MDDIVRVFLENEQKFRLVKRLGRGGFGEVWEAESPSGIHTAIKVSLDPIDGGNPTLKKELDNLSLIKQLAGHPHIVSLLDYWLISGFLVTRWELATEGDLLQVLEEYHKQGHVGIPINKLMRWIYEAANGLDFLHAKGIYHRDIKPQNLLLFHGHVKIGDLGLAKLVGASTASHTGSGTFGYLPPEAWEERRLTPTVDLYSLAATYIKLRTGREPFGTNPVEIVERQKRGEPILDGLPREEKAVLMQALHFDPRKRFSAGAESWVRSLYEALRRGNQSGIVRAELAEAVTRESETVFVAELVRDIQPTTGTQPVKMVSAKREASSLNPGQETHPKPPEVTRKLTGRPSFWILSLIAVSFICIFAATKSSHWLIFSIGVFSLIKVIAKNIQPIADYAALFDRWFLRGISVLEEIVTK